MSSGHFSIGDGHAVYRGPATDSRLHRHAAFQIVIALRDEVALADAAGAEHRATTLVVPPMVPHRLLPSPELVSFYIEPPHPVKQPASPSGPRPSSSRSQLPRAPRSQRSIAMSDMD